MESSIDAALGRVALVLRLIGAVWMVMLATVYGLSGQLESPLVALVTAGLGVGWALVAWWTGWMRAAVGRDWSLLAADLGITVAVIIIPALAQEAATYTGGYPFAALVVGLAAGGRRGVVVATGVLSAATLAALALVGRELSPIVVGNLLLYVMGAVALALGVEVIRGTEHRARRAEAALLVAEERAATAAHLHDSVLQTLALVQRRAEEAGAVRSLARRQERELREWLFPEGPDAEPPSARSGPDGSMGHFGRDPGREGEDPGPVSRAHWTRSGPDGSMGQSGHDPGREEGEEGRLGAALERHAEDIEERHGVAIRVVTVGGVARLVVPAGDRDGLAPLVMAAREAMANAAVHAGVDAVDVFAEADEHQVSVYVRDRGQGFDPDAVPDDRQGIRGSIVGRMARAGGSATITSTAGRGTEVRISLAHESPGGGRPGGGRPGDDQHGGVTE